VAGFSVPLLFDNNGTYELLVGSDEGSIYHYGNIDGNLNGTFTILDSTYQNIKELKRVTLSKADIDGDTKFDLLTGCNSGGMRLYTQYTSAGIQQATRKMDFKIAPNPTSDYCTVYFNSETNTDLFQLSILDLSGRVLYSTSTVQKQMQLFTSNLTSGVYIVHVVSDGLTYAQKLCIQR
jgi:hypothetical protein